MQFYHRHLGWHLVSKCNPHVAPHSPLPHYPVSNHHLRLAAPPLDVYSKQCVRFFFAVCIGLGK